VVLEAKEKIRMTRKFRMLTLAIALALGFSALVAATATARPATHKKGVTITIWDYFVNSPKERAALMTVANQWAKKTGNSVVNPGDVADSLTKYPLAAKGGQGPDVFQFPHDRLGSYAQPGLLAPPPRSMKINPSLYAKVGMQAVTNKAMVQTVPKTWNALVATAKRLTSGDTYGLLWNPTDLYYNYAFIGGFGGYIFKPTPKGFNWARLGLATPGAIQGLQLIQDAVIAHKLVPATTTYDIADGKFANGQAAMIINGPWAVQNYAAKGINFGMAPLPTLSNNKSPTPLVGVQMYGVNSHSKNVKAAWDLVNYLSTRLPMPLYQASGRVPALVSAAKSKTVQSSAVTKAVLAAASKGEPMPNIPEMSVVWTPVSNALQLLVKGDLTPRQAAVQMTNQVAQAISKLHQGLATDSAGAAVTSRPPGRSGPAAKRRWQPALRQSRSRAGVAHARLAHARTRRTPTWRRACSSSASRRLSGSSTASGSRSLTTTA
jgi:arabinogalactan oligomer/maltooligosaccharide transport system substrate-binding protein